MHEMFLLRGLMQKIERVARDERAHRVEEVRLKLGALAHISPSHLREHFTQAAAGGVAEGARLVIEVGRDTTAPDAQDIRLQSIVVEEGR